jgi:solute carrier family 39 (zinc transporter), member 7
LLISAFPCLILAFIPIQVFFLLHVNIFFQSKTNEESPLLRTLLAFGAGGLLGDAFLHLIPHATPADVAHSHSHSHSHKHKDDDVYVPHDLSVGTWVLVGLLINFIECN